MDKQLKFKPKRRMPVWWVRFWMFFGFYRGRVWDYEEIKKQCSGDMDYEEVGKKEVR
jgi:hypothetical protein